MEQDKEFNKDTEVEQDQVMETAKEEHQEEEYDDVCFVAIRPSSKAGKNDSPDTGDPYLRRMYAADDGYDEQWKY